MSETFKTHWVDRYLAPFCEDTDMLEKARKYLDPQSAWDAWDNAADMLRFLQKTGIDLSRILLCICDMVERVLPIFEREYPTNKHLRNAIEAARDYNSDPTEANKQMIYNAAKTTAKIAFYVGLKADVTSSAVLNASRAVSTLTFASYDFDRDNAARTAAKAVAYAVHAAVLAATNATVDAVCIVEHAAEIERKAQADIVRKYFPIAPIPEEFVSF